MTETMDAAGGISASADYSSAGSIGGIGGVSTSETPPELLKHGYIGQLYDVVGVQARTQPIAVDEGTTIRMVPRAQLDDGTQFVLMPDEVEWSVLEGNYIIDPPGVIITGPVYANQRVVVGVRYQTIFSTPVTVIANTDPDNFPPYDDDGLPDDWQVRRFGLSNTNAAPEKDPDNDGQDNRHEYYADTIPTDPASRFRFDITNQWGSVLLELSPIRANRSYSIEFTTNNILNDFFVPLIEKTEQDIDGTRIVTVTNKVGNMRFYRVRISTNSPAGF